MSSGNNEIKVLLESSYGWHPLMLNAATKTHEIFQEYGLNPGQSFVNSYNHPRFNYIDPDLNKVKSLVKPADYILFMPRLLRFQLHCDPKVPDKVDLYLREIASNRKAKGYLFAMNFEGQFEEQKLQAFLYGCLKGSAA